MTKVVMTPSLIQIEQAVDEFDAENEVIEEALRHLFTTYPDNINRSHVLLKVTALNTLYSTQIPLYNSRVPTILDLVGYIVSLPVDQALAQGDEQLVSHIAKVVVSQKASRFYYSFATKYCSWHNHGSYPIFDSRVVEYLWYLRNRGQLNKFPQADLWLYPKFKGIILEFQKRNGLERLTFKEIDKFLYLQGRALLVGREERKTGVDETILVPVPGQPGEMEWSEENYPSPEKAEESRKRFIDSEGWAKASAKDGV